MLGEDVVLFAENPGLAALLINGLKSLPFRGFNLFVELHNTEETHEPDDSNDTSHPTRPSSLSNVSCLTRGQESGALLHDRVPDPATIRKHGNGRDHVQPKEEAIEVPVNCNASQNNLNAVSSERKESEPEKDIVCTFRKCYDADIVEKQRVDGDHSHDDLRRGVLDEPSKLEPPQSFLAALFFLLKITHNLRQVFMFLGLLWRASDVL